MKYTLHQKGNACCLPLQQSDRYLKAMKLGGHHMLDRRLSASQALWEKYQQSFYSGSSASCQLRILSQQHRPADICGKPQAVVCCGEGSSLPGDFLNGIIRNHLFPCTASNMHASLPFALMGCASAGGAQSEMNWTMSRNGSGHRHGRSGTWREMPWSCRRSAAQCQTCSVPSMHRCTHCILIAFSLIIHAGVTAVLYTHLLLACGCVLTLTWTCAVDRSKAVH